jgi:hypothetical protein
METVKEEPRRKRNSFLARTAEKWELNQYWYASNTIAMLTKEIEEHATKVAFLSTPSVWFSLENPDIKSRSFFFDVSPPSPPSLLHHLHHLWCIMSTISALPSLLHHVHHLCFSIFTISGALCPPSLLHHLHYYCFTMSTISASSSPPSLLHHLCFFFMSFSASPSLPHHLCFSIFTIFASSCPSLLHLCPHHLWFTISSISPFCSVSRLTYFLDPMELMVEVFFFAGGFAVGEACQLRALELQ